MHGEDDDYEVDSDDEIVRELDVFISEPDLSLYLLQFPLRPIYANQPDVIDARFKPEHEILELNVNHDAMDTPLRMLSTKVAQDTQFGVALLRGEELHISPLNQVLQMRPSFKNLASSSSASSSSSYNNNSHSSRRSDSVSDDDASDADDAMDTRDEGQSKPALQKVVLQKMESERMHSARLQSFAYLSKQQEDEPYQRLRAHLVDSASSDAQFDKCYFQEQTQSRGSKKP